MLILLDVIVSTLTIAGLGALLCVLRSLDRLTREATPGPPRPGGPAA